MNSNQRFIVDGYARHIAEIEPAIRNSVEAESSQRYAIATGLGRLWIRWLMRREIRRRIQQAASPYSLY